MGKAIILPRLRKRFTGHRSAGFFGKMACGRADVPLGFFAALLDPTRKDFDKAVRDLLPGLERDTT